MLTLQRGDTIIEVLLAVTLFSLVSVGTMTVMNQGMNTALRSLEVTQVKQQVDAQAEALRAARTAHFASPKSGDEWSRITGADDHETTTTVGDKCRDDVAATGAFAMNGRTGQITPSLKSMNSGISPVPHAQVQYADSADAPGASKVVKQVYGLWIDKKLASGSTDVKAYDFTIHACWYGPGLNVPMTVQTVVRLYDD